MGTTVDDIHHRHRHLVRRVPQQLKQLFTLFLGSFAFIFGVMLVAFCLIAVVKLLLRLLKPDEKE